MGRTYRISGALQRLDGVWQGFGKVGEARGAASTWFWNVLGLCSGNFLKGREGRTVHPGFPSLHHHDSLLPSPSQCSQLHWD